MDADIRIARVVLAAGCLLTGAAAAAAAPEAPGAYQAICRHCHESGVGPELRGRQLQPLYIDLFVRRGMRAMPSFPRSFIDDATLAEIARFIEKSGPPPGALPAAGAPR